MKRALILASMIGAATPALAALPPDYQRAAELRAVIGVATEVLGTIDAIVYIAHDMYEVRSEDCVVMVRIEDLPREPRSEPRIGPRHFRAIAEPATCD